MNGIVSALPDVPASEIAAAISQWVTDLSSRSTLDPVDFIGVVSKTDLLGVAEIYIREGWHGMPARPQLPAHFGV